MSRIVLSSVIAAGALTLSLSTAASAQGINSNCVPTEAQPCFTLTPLEANRGSTIAPPPGVDLLNASELGQTFACNVVTGNAVGGVSGPLIQDCGPPATLGNVKPYYGVQGAPAPMAAPAPTVVMAPPPPPPVTVQIPVPVAPTPVVTGPVLSAGGLGLGTPGIVATAAGVAGLLGIIGLIASSDDSD